LNPFNTNEGNPTRGNGIYVPPAWCTYPQGDAITSEIIYGNPKYSFGAGQQRDCRQALKKYVAPHGGCFANVNPSFYAKFGLTQAQCCYTHPSPTFGVMFLVSADAVGQLWIWIPSIGHVLGGAHATDIEAVLGTTRNHVNILRLISGVKFVVVVVVCWLWLGF
jgi:hypothetical protein